MTTKTYSELSALQTYNERLEYLKLNGKVGDHTFGDYRYINQNFYRSTEWKKVRDYVIVRDGGCDLGIPDLPIVGGIYVHHINPIGIDDIYHSSDFLLDPENLICVSLDTHNEIHYGIHHETDQLIVRRVNDTCPWKK